MRRDILFASLVLAVLAALFQGLVFGGQVLFERDVHQMLYSQYASFARMVHAGSLPLWDPWTGFGQPMLANPNAQALYPPTWLCLVLSPEATYTVFVLVHLAVGALAMRALAGRLGASPLAASLAAILWMLSGPILSLVNLWHHLAGACLMPLVLLAADRALAHRTLRSALHWGGVMGLQGLAGSLDMCLFTAALTAAWALHRFTDRHDIGRPRPGRWLLATTATAGAVALAFAASLLLPALDLVRASARAALSEDVRTFWSLHPALLLQIVLPVFPHDLPLPPDLRAALFQNREPFMPSVYLGLAALPLVGWALLPRPRRHALVLSLIFGASALLALGRYGFAYPALVALVPPLRSLRYPVKVTVLLAVAWALIAALGLDALRDGDRDRRSRLGLLALGGVGSLAAIALAMWLFDLSLGSAARPLFLAAGLCAATTVLVTRGTPRTWGVVATVVLVGLDVLQAHGSLNATAAQTLFETPPQVTSKLASTGFVRLATWDYLSRLQGKAYRRESPHIPRDSAPRDVRPSLAAALARRDFLSPPTAARFGFFGSFDRDWLGLQPRGVRNLSLWFQRSEETPEFLRLLRVGGVTHTVGLHEEGLEELEPVAVEVSDFAGPVYLKRVPGPRPRVYAVDGARVADGLVALKLLVDPGFDPGREIVKASGEAAPHDPAFTSECRLVEDRSDRLLIEARLEAPGYVVALDSFDPGWIARIDGREAPLLRANVGFRAVAVPPGRHEVEMLYRPRGLWLGLASSGAALVLVVGSLVPRGSRAEASG